MRVPIPSMLVRPCELYDAIESGQSGAVSVRRTVVIAARIGALALGREILVSSLVYGLAEGLGTFTFDGPRTVTLKGLHGSFDVYPVVA